VPQGIMDVLDFNLVKRDEFAWIAHIFIRPDWHNRTTLGAPSIDCHSIRHVFDPFDLHMRNLTRRTAHNLKGKITDYCIKGRLNSCQFPLVDAFRTSSSSIRFRIRNPATQHQRLIPCS